MDVLTTLSCSLKPRQQRRQVLARRLLVRGSARQNTVSKQLLTALSTSTKRERRKKQKAQNKRLELKEGSRWEQLALLNAVHAQYDTLRQAVGECKLTKQNNQMNCSQTNSTHYPNAYRCFTTKQTLSWRRVD